MTSHTYKELLTHDQQFNCQEGLFYQKGFQKHNSFEEGYLKLREREGRVYTDDVVRQLPDFRGPDNLYSEWKMRKRSAHRLINHLQRNGAKHVLEVGCGNGWLVNYLHKKISADFCGVDINEAELQQAVRNSNKTSSVSFLYGDILSDHLNNFKADVIILASVIQYFPDLNTLIKKLSTHLLSNGEIHIIDAPIYDEWNVAAAQIRSEKYFSDSGVHLKEKHYYHHSWKSLESFNYEIIYQPKSTFNKLKKLFIKDSPFPWIIIANYKN